MSIRMMHQFKRIQTTSSAKFVGMMLADHLNESTGRCDPSVALLCAETCLEERAVRRALKTLREGGHITQVCRAGTTPVYRLHPQIPEDCTLPQIDTPPQNDTPVKLSPSPIETGGSPPNRQGTPPQIDRGVSPKSPPKSERTRREPEENHFASAAADAGNTDSLFPIEPPPPKPKREPKPETTADPRKAHIMAKLKAVYLDAMGSDLAMEPSGYARTQKELDKLLPLIPNADKDEILNQWHAALCAARHDKYASAKVHESALPFLYFSPSRFSVINSLVASSIARTNQ